MYDAFGRLMLHDNTPILMYFYEQFNCLTQTTKNLHILPLINDIMMTLITDTCACKYTQMALSIAFMSFTANLVLFQLMPASQPHRLIATAAGRPPILQPFLGAFFGPFTHT